ncbi:MAG: tRNA (adenosine(37)-N6)-threonylcarbamoyltransferase complex ATPase subunit type 1 TsaE [Pseudomonadota bacterium]
MCSIDYSASSFLATDEDTTALGKAMAPLLTAGDVLLLSGPIGAGKTHLARAIIQTRLPVPEDVPSPTYTLVQTYRTAECEIWHADLYRLADSSEVEELGLIDAFDTAIVLIEWPDRLAVPPTDALHVTLTPQDGGRRIDFASANPRWERLRDALAHA